MGRTRPGLQGDGLEPALLQNAGRREGMETPRAGSVSSRGPCELVPAAPPTAGSQWSAPSPGAGSGSGPNAERPPPVLAWRGRPRLRRQQPKQPWRNGGAQGCPSAVLGAGPGRSTQGEWARSGYVAQALRAAGERSPWLWLWRWRRAGQGF